MSFYTDASEAPALSAIYVPIFTQLILGAVLLGLGLLILLLGHRRWLRKRK